MGRAIGYELRSTVTRNKPPGFRTKDNDMPPRTSMDSAELQARVTLASALIASRAVEIPSSLPHTGRWTDDDAAVRLRDLTDYLYQVLAADPADGTN